MRVERSRMASDAVAFAGVRCVQNEGMYQLTAGYAASHLLPFFHISDKRDCRIRPTTVTSLLVCCPPCSSGIVAWLSALLPVCDVATGRVVMLLDDRQSWQSRLAHRLFCAPMSVVHDRDPAEYIASELCTPPVVRRSRTGSVWLSGQEKWVLSGYLQGEPAGVQAHKAGLSVKSIYRLRKSGLARLGMKNINDPGPAEY